MDLDVENINDLLEDVLNDDSEDEAFNEKIHIILLISLNIFLF